MTPNQYVKSRGLDGVHDLIKATGESRQTLRNWYNNKRKLFDCCIDSVLLEKRSEQYENEIRDLQEEIRNLHN